MLFILGVGFNSCSNYTPQVPEFEYAELSEDYFQSYTKVDSTLNRFVASPHITATLDSLFYTIELLLNYDENIALEYAKEANRIATEKGEQKARALSYYYMALLKGRQQILHETLEGAIVDAEIAQQLFEKTNLDQYKIETRRLLGDLHNRQKKREQALQYLNEALELLDKSQLPEKKAVNLKGEIIHTLANVYFSQKDNKLAMENFRKSLELYQTIDNQSAMSRLWIAMGRLHLRENKYQLTDSLYQLSLNYALNNNDQHLLGTVFNRLGYLNYKQFRKSNELSFYEQAISYYKKGVEVAKDNQYYFYNRMGITYQMRAATSHYLPSNIDSAIVNYARALKQAQVEGAFNIMPSLVQNISNLCNDRERLTGNNCDDLLGKSNATLLNESYASVNKSVVNDLKKANQKSNDFERKLLEAENTRQIQVQRWLGLGILLFAGLIFLIILQSVRQKRLQAKMEALRAQINPHFISNSLNAIESLVNLDKKEDASKYIIHFARLSRQILNGSREANTVLAKELKMLEHFLALEQLRFRDKLSYQIEVDKNVESGAIEIPAMILQPYVENAIWHGIKPKEGKGFLQIKISRTDKELHCIIEDNGVGRAKAAELKAASVLQQKSVGMQINHERLQASGKVKGSRIKIEDLFDNDGKPAGTKVMLRLALKYKK